MSAVIGLLPSAIVALVACTTAVTDTGTFPPESCIFGQALNIASALIAFAIYLKYLQVEEIYQKHHIEDKYKVNKIALIFGFVASLGLNMVANFQETNAFIVHWFAAILSFGVGSLYLSMQSIVYIKISPVIGQRKTTMFRILISLLSSVAFLVCLVAAFKAYAKFQGEDITKWKVEDGGFELHQTSTIAEWICASSIMMYIALLHEEFKSVTVKPLSICLDEHKISGTNVTS